jgi:hypothetical protein
MGRSALTMVLRSFHEQYRSDVRIRCTTQVWTDAWGQVASMASGRPLSPSQQTNKTSSTPRLRTSVNTAAQNLAPSPPSPSHTPKMCLRPSTSTPMATYAGRFVTTPEVRTLMTRASM